MDFRIGNNLPLASLSGNFDVSTCDNQQWGSNVEKRCEQRGKLTFNQTNLKLRV